MSKIILILLLCSNILFAQSITVTGYGDTKDKALKSAFQNAVEQEVGVLVDTRTVIKNNKLIKNKILTFSNGYIKDYTEVSSKEQLGFWTVKISAVVERQKLLLKIKKIKLKPKKITGTKKLYAQVVSQVKTKFDAEDIFIKFYNTFTSVPTENYYAKVNDFKIDSDLATRTIVPVKISVDVEYNKADVVKNKFNEMYNLLDQLSIDKKVVSTKTIVEEFKNKWRSKEFPNEIIFNFDNSSYIYFGFPRSYSVIYPFKNQGFGSPKRERTGYIIVQALDENGKVLKSFSLNNYKFSIESMISSLKIYERGMYYENGFNGIINWDMPIKYLQRITQVKATIKWI